MADVRLAASPRTDLGSARVGRLRTSGSIPGIVYGHGVEPFAVVVDAREFRAALSTDAGTNALLDLNVDGTSHTALAREIQRHPVKGTVQHVDFQVVDRNQPIVVDVSVTLIGEASEVHIMGGQVIQDLVSLTVTATPATIPSHIEVDVSALAIGDVIRLSDLTLPNGVTTELDPETAVASGHAPVAEEVAEEAEEGADGAPAAEAPTDEPAE